MLTLSGDDIIGKILKHGMALILITVSPHGTFGSLIERFLYGKDALPTRSHTIKQLTK